MTDELLEAAVRLTEAFIAREPGKVYGHLSVGAGSKEFGESVGVIFTEIYEAVNETWDKRHQ